MPSTSLGGQQGAAADSSRGQGNLPARSTEAHVGSLRLAPARSTRQGAPLALGLRGLGSRQLKASVLGCTSRTATLALRGISRVRERLSRQATVRAAAEADNAGREIRALPERGEPFR